MPITRTTAVVLNQTLAQPNELPGSSVDLVTALRIQSKAEALTKASQNLNDLSDRLSVEVGEIETIVNALNLGVRVNVIAETSSDDGGYDHILRLGYSKSTGKWGFIIEEFVEQSPDDTYQVWAFKDAPRELRLKTVDRIPQLFDELVTKSDSLAAEISDKVKAAKQFASYLKLPRPSGLKK